MNWKLAYEQNFKCKNMNICTIADIAASGFEIIDAAVPGNVELDMMKADKLPDLYYSTNTLEAQKLENMHYWYYTELELEEPEVYLSFEGIDTIADIYINGKLAKSTDNMFMSYDVYGDFVTGKNEVVVHIKPVCIEARKYTLPMSCNALDYNYDSLYIRKAAHMYGWDIMPRIVSAGIWKPVTVKKIKNDYIKDVYVYTVSIDKVSNSAMLSMHINTELSADFCREYTVKLHGECGGSTFDHEWVMWHTDILKQFELKNPILWWPKNYGEQNMYKTTVELYHNGELCDSRELNVGIRTVELDNREMIDNNDRGEFCFKINGKKVFAMGTNWVPLDAFHSNDINRLDEAMAMVEDLGCNIIRCWGGNVYENDRFYDICDRLGVMVWQDFAMGCAVYPQDSGFAARLEQEAVFQVKRLRNHPSIIIWAGDNECDYAHRWAGVQRDPNTNILTRQVLKKVCETHDYIRPYLPSSPYMSEKTFRDNLHLQEEHTWGPRDYFKGDYYKNTDCHFASETGYHGFPSVKSLSKFLKKPEKIFDSDRVATGEYQVHAAGMTDDGTCFYKYRIPLAYSHVEILFGKAEDKLADFVKQSQISQAEAKKYFIEKFRINKWDKTGIIWWNLLDGWPQVSDAIVDYYFSKKLAYHYIKRSQQPVCLMFDEPVNNVINQNCSINLYCANDTGRDAHVTYKVTDVAAQKVTLTGEATVAPDTSVKIDCMQIQPKEKVFYLIEWELDGKKYTNHYFTNAIDIDYRSYLEAQTKCGMAQYDE